MTLAYLTVIGNKQGQFKAEGVPVQHKASIPVLAFVMELASARGAAAGPVTGKRQYQPVTVVKEWGAASPQGLAACATNEVLSTVKIEFSKTKPTGEEYTFQTVTLTNATLSDVRRFTGDLEAAEGLEPSSKEPTGLERWSFTFQKIEVADVDGKTTFVDDWQAPMA